MKTKILVVNPRNDFICISLTISIYKGCDIHEWLIETPLVCISVINSICAGFKIIQYFTKTQTLHNIFTYKSRLVAIEIEKDKKMNRFHSSQIPYKMFKNSLIA
jgi:hypothetical protein